MRRAILDALRARYEAEIAKEKLDVLDEFEPEKGSVL